MLKLEQDQLTFSFPEITGQLTALLEQHIQQLLPKLRLPENRKDLVEYLKRQVATSSTYQFRPHALDNLHGCAESLTEADVEKALRDYTDEFTLFLDDFLPIVTVEFQRTMRIPDDDQTYPLPAGLGRFPLCSVDDFPQTIPPAWTKRGGVLMPMYQSEALWINFSSNYPFALKVAAGKIDAVSGEPWNPVLQQEPQNYVILPDQPWLDGFAVGQGVIRQFVAMPLGAGYSVEEQLTGKAEVGGIQLQAHPMRAETYFREEVAPKLPSSLDGILMRLFPFHVFPKSNPLPLFWELNSGELSRCASVYEEGSAMGLGAGGKMGQEIYEDSHSLGSWDQSLSRRCFVHLCNSLVWRQITGINPPHPPFTSKEYKQAGIPWFDYYRDDQKPLEGSEQLAGIKSVAQLGKEKNSQPLPENSSTTPNLIIQYGNTRRPEDIGEFINVP